MRGLNTLTTQSPNLMFVPYRTIGLVCAGQQQYMSHLGSESFLVTSIGHGFQVWRCDHLSLSMVSSQVEEVITCVSWGGALPAFVLF